MSTCSRCHCPVSQFIFDPEDKRATQDKRRVCPCVVSWHEMWRDERHVSKWYDAWLKRMRGQARMAAMRERQGVLIEA